MRTVQQPAYLWVPEHASSAGGEVSEFAESVGLPMDEEQQMCLDAMYAETPDGQWASTEDGIICSRQNLKTHLFKGSSLADVFLFDASLVVCTAHLFATTQEMFRDLDAIVTNYDVLRRRVKKISRENGNEGIELLGNRRILFKARTKTGGRGLTGDVVYFDEAFALSASELGSVIPALSAKSITGQPKIRYGSSAGHAHSAVLRALRDRGRAGNDTRLAYVEFCAERRSCANDKCDHLYGTPGCVLDDEELWEQANPALDRRISRDFVRVERRTLPPDEFMRERLGWWEDPEESNEGLSFDAWSACADLRSKTADEVVFAIAVAKDLSWTAIGVAGLRPDGLPHVEVVDYRRGTDWVAGRAKELVDGYDAALVVEERGPRSTIADELAELGLEPMEAKPNDVVDACGLLEDRVLRRGLRQIGQPELDTAVRGARRRQVGEGWMFARKASLVEISPAISVTLALWGLSQLGDLSGDPDFFII